MGCFSVQKSKYKNYMLILSFTPRALTIAYRDKHVVLLNQVASNGVQPTPKDSPQQEVQQGFESQGVQQHSIKSQHQSPIDDVSHANWLGANEERPDTIDQNVYNHPADLGSCVNNCIGFKAGWQVHIPPFHTLHHTHQQISPTDGHTTGNRATMLFKLTACRSAQPQLPNEVGVAEAKFGLDGVHTPDQQIP